MVRGVGCNCEEVRRRKDCKHVASRIDFPSASMGVASRFLKDTLFIGRRELPYLGTSDDLFPEDIVAVNGDDI